MPEDTDETDEVEVCLDVAVGRGGSEGALGVVSSASVVVVVEASVLWDDMGSVLCWGSGGGGIFGAGMSSSGLLAPLSV